MKRNRILKDECKNLILTKANNGASGRAWNRAPDIRTGLLPRAVRVRASNKFSVGKSLFPTAGQNMENQWENHVLNLNMRRLRSSQRQVRVLRSGSLRGWMNVAGNWGCARVTWNKPKRPQRCFFYPARWNIRGGRTGVNESFSGNRQNLSPSPDDDNCWIRNEMKFNENPLEFFFFFLQTEGNACRLSVSVRKLARGRSRKWSFPRAPCSGFVPDNENNAWTGQ